MTEIGRNVSKTVGSRCDVLKVIVNEGAEVPVKVSAKAAWAVTLKGWDRVKAYGPTATKGLAPMMPLNLRHTFQPLEEGKEVLAAVFIRRTGENLYERINKELTRTFKDECAHAEGHITRAQRESRFMFRYTCVVVPYTEGREPSSSLYTPDELEFSGLNIYDIGPRPLAKYGD